MKIGRWAWFLLMAASSLAGCKGFWDAPVTGSFALTNSANISVSSGAAETGTSTITVTPSNSFTGTVALACAVTTSISSPTSTPTCSLSPTSVSITDTSAQTSSLTATTTATTTAGIYDITVTGTSGSTSETTTVCVAVGSDTCTSTASNSGKFYILNGGSSPGIIGRTIVSGTLTPISGSTVSLSGVIPYAMAIAPNGKFLCVSTSNGVFAYPITNGALGTGVQVTQDVAYAVQVDSTDSWLVEAIPFTGGSGGVGLSAVHINSSTGTFVTGSSEPTATISIAGATLPLGQMVISPDDKYIFVALETGGTIVIPFNSSNPLPAGVSYTPIPVAHSGGTALSVAVDPSTTPRLYYIGEVLGDLAGTSGGLRAFNYASLPSVSEISSSQIASGGLAPTFILPVATPDYVYVADSAGSITGFSVTGSASPYTLATGSTVTAGAQPASMAEDSTDSFIFEVGSSGSPYFDAYTFDANTTGQLDSQVTSTTAATSIAVVAVP